MSHVICGPEYHAQSLRLNLSKLYSLRSNSNSIPTRMSNLFQIQKMAVKKPWRMRTPMTDTFYSRWNSEGKLERRHRLPKLATIGDRDGYSYEWWVAGEKTLTRPLALHLVLIGEQEETVIHREEFDGRTGVIVPTSQIRGVMEHAQKMPWRAHEGTKKMV